MAVLIAGGAGYIGSHTAVELINRGVDVLIGDNFSRSGKNVISAIEKITGRTIVCWEVDFRDYGQTAKLFASGPIDAVINFAAYKAVGESVQKPLSYYENNLNVLINLCRAMEEFHVAHMIFSSSATVYGSGPSPMREEQPLEETENPYGETKKVCERILSDFFTSNRGKRICVLRYFNPIGAHESGLIGEHMEEKPTNLMPLLCSVAKGKRDVLEVYGYDYPTPDGTGIRDYIHVTDVAKGHAAAQEFLNRNPGFHVFNLGTGQGVSVLELIETFKRVNGVDVPYRFVPRRSGDVAECYASVERAKHVLGWRAKRSLEDMVRDAWRFECGCRV